MKITTVIFDFGGVLLDWDRKYYYKNVFKTEDEMNFFLDNICTLQWNSQMDKGFSFDECILKLCKEHPEFEKEIKAYKDNWHNMLRGAIDDGVAILDKIYNSHKFRLLGLTNWSHETFPYAKKNYKFLEKFEGILVSGEEKMIKPDAEIFERMISKFNLNANECVFIDDNIHNIEASIKAGFIGVLCKDHNKAKKELTKLLEIDF